MSDTAARAFFISRSFSEPVVPVMSSSTWECSVCTCINEGLDSCAACSNPCPETLFASAQGVSHGAASDVVDGGAWACEACTYHNSIRSRRCTLCGGARPAAFDATPAAAVSSRAARAIPMAGTPGQAAALDGTAQFPDAPQRFFDWQQPTINETMNAI